MKPGARMLILLLALCCLALPARRGQTLTLIPPAIR